MAKQTGIIKLKGTIEDVSFYKTIDGHLARKKGGIDPERIKTDPRFQRTRENNEEFGGAAKSAKQLRRAIKPLLKTAGDPRMLSRLVGVMFQIKNFDTMNARGKRNVGVGILDPQSSGLLKDFEFNRFSELGEVLQLDHELDMQTGTVTIEHLVPLEDLTYPTGATHFSMRSAWLNIDFANRVHQLRQSPVVVLPIDTSQSDIELTPVAVPAGNGINLHFLLIAFFQEVNGVQYSMKNGVHNALAVVGVS